ncbi:MAG: tRNA (adenosine(37)-N6)-threonylcarbamoyltransferase complex transferase subunit TsaD [Deltaproteobacteria bacterium]|nr:tRNA (adenosine(37)-N6)-threonylcarbamoyltransferase complex transferase subunit TsaD [Deltaproteobacteria bacterium]
MRVLAIESSCDETAAAVLSAPFDLESSIVASQVVVHAPYGGVVPELASRHHVEAVVPVVRQALATARRTLDEIDVVAATSGPGLIGSLMVGLQVAKGIAFARGLPFIGVHHLEGHLCAPFLAAPRPEFPFLALLVSGGHTGLYAVRAVGDITCLGATRDDAAGEAFDKVAALLGLGYPGGVAIERAAAGGDAARFMLPRALRGRRNLDFSFSGLKTAARIALERLGDDLDATGLRDFCASVQAAIVDSLIEKSRWALRQVDCRRLVVAGGVAANRALREALEALRRSDGIDVYLPPLSYCTDNAAMIAVAAALRWSRGDRDPLTKPALATWPLAS